MKVIILCIMQCIAWTSLRVLTAFVSTKQPRWFFFIQNAISRSHDIDAAINDNEIDEDPYFQQLMASHDDQKERGNAAPDSGGTFGMNDITNAIKQNTKYLNKGDSSWIRARSADSFQSSVHSPPASPQPSRPSSPQPEPEVITENRMSKVLSTPRPHRLNLPDQALPNPSLRW